MPSAQRLLQAALAVVGCLFLLLYPISVVWPAGWQWHTGPPHASEYFLMIVGLYATLGIFLLLAARNPQAHRSLIWFTVWSSLVHAVVMAVQSVVSPHHRGHLWGDVSLLLVVAAVLAWLMTNAHMRPEHGEPDDRA